MKITLDVSVADLELSELEAWLLKFNVSIRGMLSTIVEVAWSDERSNVQLFNNFVSTLQNEDEKCHSKTFKVDKNSGFFVWIVFSSDTVSQAELDTVLAFAAELTTNISVSVTVYKDGNEGPIAQLINGCLNTSL